ncbi:pectinesterase inhibitor-like protein [Tanacetum coccineum]
MEEVCNQVPEKALCFEILKNDSRSLSGKLEDFAKRAVEVAVNNATGLPDYVKSLANNATRSIMKSRILRCVQNTEDAFRYIKKAKQLVQTHQYGPANNMASLASVALSDCDNNFWKPPAQPIELKQATYGLRALVVIVCVFTNDLG